MKAGVYYGPDDVRIEDLPKPSAGTGEVLIRVRACGLCGTDIAKYRHCLVEPPVVLGHEVAGDIEEVGAGVSGFKKGDRVVLLHHIPCFVCDYCRHGHHTMCEAFRPSNIEPGGFAEFLRVASASVAKSMQIIPDDLSYEAASMAESTACCLRGILRCNIRPGDSVAVIGAGPAGLILAQLARTVGAAKIVVTDLVQRRLDAALELGADEAVNVSSEDPAQRVKDLTYGGPDVVIVAVGSPKAQEQALLMAKKGSVVNFFAECPPGSVVQLDPNLIYHSEISLVGSYSSTPPDLRAALRLIHSGRINTAGLITHCLPLEELQKAFHLAVDAQESLKIVINP